MACTGYPLGSFGSHALLSPLSICSLSYPKAMRNGASQLFMTPPFHFLAQGDPTLTPL
jgi:hypothetical protein